MPHNSCGRLLQAIHDWFYNHPDIRARNAGSKVKSKEKRNLAQPSHRLHTEFIDDELDAVEENETDAMCVQFSPSLHTPQLMGLK
jgi:carbamoylphosphate synthase small subunit